MVPLFLFHFFLELVFRLEHFCLQFFRAASTLVSTKVSIWFWFVFALAQLAEVLISSLGGWRLLREIISASFFFSCSWTSWSCLSISDWDLWHHRDVARYQRVGVWETLSLTSLLIRFVFSWRTYFKCWFCCSAYSNSSLYMTLTRSTVPRLFIALLLPLLENLFLPVISSLVSLLSLSPQILFVKELLTPIPLKSRY